MKKIIHRAADRGIQDHGWLKAAHSFSFAQYHDPSKVHFGLLRVLNDDIIAPGMGFGTHGHENMEIVTIPLKGILAHKDSLGSEGNITFGEVQVMSAGSGIRHSEFNGSSTEETSLLQIWVFPKKRNIQPRYDQMRYDLEKTKNSFLTLVSPKEGENIMWINQDAFFSMGTFDSGKESYYNIQHPANGAYVFVIEGQAELDGTLLNTRDAMGVYDIDTLEFKFSENSRVLIIEVPMQ
jgi:redox-sensitive bicupin YhaK (pirin superfamily)